MTTDLYRVRAGYTYSGETDLRILCCPVCGVTYAIPQRMQTNAYDKGEGLIQWFCPNGHQLGYHGPSEAERERNLRTEADRRANAERELREHTEHKLRAQKGATTKAKKRHAAGVCPCCNRSFENVRRHMATKHPDFDPAKEPTP